MKKLLVSLAALALIGAGLAQDIGAAGHTPPPTPSGDYSDNSEGGRTASLTETVYVNIPDRVALHLTDTGFTLDLNDLQGSIDAHPALDCFLVQKDAIADFTSYEEFTEAISGLQVRNYPAVVFDENNNVAMAGDDYLKGGLACVNTKVAQKFSNYVHGWKLSADVNIPTLSGIKFAIMDSVDNNPWYIADGDTSVCLIWFFRCLAYDGAYSYYVPESTFGFHNPLELDNSILARQRLGKTNGWLDDHISEWFYFDGSEIAGNHEVSIMFTLTGGL